ncbi:hypothetical protein SAMN02990966_07453 [Rhodospirillales bacterium URHD0017]|nr:hypothetical protein SAMN02990966_07453 [Rhodospirillales bacterium URHD0017]
MKYCDPSNDPDRACALEEMRAYASFLLRKLDEQHVDLPPGVVCTIPWPPGMLGDLARYLYVTSPKPIPALAIASAIAIVRAICGRRWFSSLPVLAVRNLHTAKETLHVALGNFVQQLPGVEQFVVDAPFAESTPNLFDKMLDSNLLGQELFRSHFLIFEEQGLQPSPNENLHWNLPKWLRNYLGEWIRVTQDRPNFMCFAEDKTDEGYKALKRLRVNCQNEGWGISFDKCHSLVALVAVADDFMVPTIDVEHVVWASELLLGSRV